MGTASTTGSVSRPPSQRLQSVGGAATSGLFDLLPNPDDGGGDTGGGDTGGGESDVVEPAPDLTPNFDDDGNYVPNNPPDLLDLILMNVNGDVSNLTAEQQDMINKLIAGGTVSGDDPRLNPAAGFEEEAIEAGAGTEGTTGMGSGTARRPQAGAGPKELGLAKTTNPNLAAGGVANAKSAPSAKGGPVQTKPEGQPSERPASSTRPPISAQRNKEVSTAGGIMPGPKSLAKINRKQPKGLIS